MDDKTRDFLKVLDGHHIGPALLPHVVNLPSDTYAMQKAQYERLLLADAEFKEYLGKACEDLGLVMQRMAELIPEELIGMALERIVANLSEDEYE